MLGVAAFAVYSYVRSVPAGNDVRFWLVAQFSRLTERPHATADDAPISYVPPNRLGVNTFLEQEVDPAKRRLVLEMAREAGFHWIRQQFPWQELEPERKGDFSDPKFGGSTWDKYDGIVDTANQLGLELIVRLDTTPKWARLGNDHPNTPPDRLQDFGDYVAAVVTHYRGRVRYYQLWNEPNLTVEWGMRGVDPVAATALLREGYIRAKAADPEAVILAPALAPTIEEDGAAMNELKFMQAMYDAGAARYFDIASVQAYGLRSGPDDRRLSAGDVNFSRPILFREVMVRNGDAAKPIWASEVGWNAPPPDAPPPDAWGRVTPDQQARYTVRALERARAEWPWMGVMNVWYLKEADDRNMHEQIAGFRLLDPTFAPRPIYAAIKRWATGN
jgi:hypothetical protein